MNEDLIKEEMSEIHQISTAIAILNEQIKVLVQQMTEMKSDIKEIKEIQSEKINGLEKKVALLEDKVGRLEWMNKVIGTAAVAAMLGAIFNLILESPH